MNHGRRYLLISPCRDEAEFLGRTIESVARQTIPPAEWIIVDDGSTDRTPELLAEYEERYPFIRVVRKPDRGGRSVGPGVIEAFYHGYEHADVAKFDYLCKLDLDLDLPERYFEALIERMEANPRLGTCSGKPYYEASDGRLVSEKCGDEAAVGAAKFYRRQCFEEIGGFVRQVMWDGIDGHRCRMLGWIAQSWDDPEIRFLHLRPMGSSHKGILTGRMRHGYGQYFMGTGPVYMTASALFRMTRPPFVLGGLGMWLGYVKAMLSGAERYDDTEFRQFLRAFQWSCLLRGKREATAKVEDAGGEVWARTHEAPEHPETAPIALPAPLSKAG